VTSKVTSGCTCRLTNDRTTEPFRSGITRDRVRPCVRAVFGPSKHLSQSGATSTLTHVSPHTAHSRRPQASRLLVLLGQDYGRSRKPSPAGGRRVESNDPASRGRHPDRSSSRIYRRGRGYSTTWSRRSRAPSTQAATPDSEARQQLWLCAASSATSPCASSSNSRGIVSRCAGFSHSRRPKEDP
jgi:hypothetical protein